MLIYHGPAAPENGFICSTHCIYLANKNNYIVQFFCNLVVQYGPIGSLLEILDRWKKLNKFKVMRFFLLNKLGRLSGCDTHRERDQEIERERDKLGRRSRA